MIDIKKTLNEFPPKVKDLFLYLSSVQTDIYIIGGFVRDLALNKKSFDLDFILIDEDPNIFCQKLSLTFPGKAILLDKETKITRFVLEDEETKPYTFDFTGVPKNKLEEDFRRRDFTINALALNLKDPTTIIDKFNGLEDLKNKRIKIIEEKNLKEDPLRILRAFRFSALLNGFIDEGNLKILKSNLIYFNEISQERVSYELWKMLECDNSSTHLKNMSDIGLLEKIFPELTECRKVPENAFHHLNLYDHSVHLIGTFESHFYKIPLWAQEYLSLPHGEIYSPKKKAIAKLGSLLHDIGKPQTWEIKNIKGEEKHTFIGHDKVGATISEDICERLKVSNAIKKSIGKLIKQHLRPFQLNNGGLQISKKALFRFFRELEEDTPLLLMLALADHHATCGPKVSEEDLANGENLILFLFEKYREYYEFNQDEQKKKTLLDGNEIMEITGISPSKELGNLMKELDELVGIGEIVNKDEAILWVKNKLRN